MKIKADQQFSKISDDKRWAGNMVCGAGGRAMDTWWGRKLCLPLKGSLAKICSNS